MDHIFNRRDIGYTLISRFEESFRQFLSMKLQIHYSDCFEGIPNGAIDKAKDRSSSDKWEDIDDFFDDSDFPDLKEIACFQGRFQTYFPNANISQNEFEIIMDKVYVLRNKIAHVKQHFSSFDLDQLLESTRKITPLLEQQGEEYIIFVRHLEEHPNEFVIPMPVEFADNFPEVVNIPNNIPIPDYEYEGGFVGRIDDMRKITQLLEGSRNVITISGAGGVGKTALALRIIKDIAQKPEQRFDGIVWLSAKETKLSYLGIEDIEPTVKNYEELLDTIFEVMGFGDPRASLEQKESDVETIFELCKHVLIVIDNFETITDDRITNFILDIEDNYPDIKILVTSRRGLGQVERRHELKQLKVKEAVSLFRRIAKDKRINSLVKIDDATLTQYVNKVACYPLAIKWVVGQIAIGKDVNDVIGEISETTSDISKFSFEQVFRSLSPTAKKILCALSVLDDPPSAGVLNYVVDTEKDDFEDSLQELILVSLVVPETYKNEQNELVNRFTLLSLTRGYVRQQLDNDSNLKREIAEKLDKVQATIEEAERARKQYRFSLANLGAITEEERVAAMIAQNAFQKYQTGRYAEAVEDYKRAIEIAPRFSSLYRNWAVMESQEQHSVEANELMRKASTLNPEDTQIWLAWGNIRRKEGRIKDALEKYERAHELSPEDGVILNALGQAKARAGDYAEADMLFKKALEIESKGSSVQNEIINRSSIAGNLTRWAKADQKSRQYEVAEEKLFEALKQCEVVVQLDKSDRRSQELLRRTLRDLAYTLKRKNPELALSYFMQARIDKQILYMRHKEVTEHITACLQAGKILWRLGRIDEVKQVVPHDLRSKIDWASQKPKLRKEFNDFWRKLHTREASNHKPSIGKGDFSSEKEFGTVKWFSSQKGYGFIISDKGAEIFVHISNVFSKNYPPLKEGQRVEFVTALLRGKDQEEASKVKIVEGE